MEWGRNTHVKVCTYLNNSRFLQRKQNKWSLFLWTSSEHVRVSFLYHLKWLSTCFINVNLILGSKILKSSQGGSRFCKVSICNLRGPLKEKEYKIMNINYVEGVASTGPWRVSTSSFSANSPPRREPTKPYISISPTCCPAALGILQAFGTCWCQSPQKQGKTHTMFFNSRTGPGPSKWFKINFNSSFSYSLNDCLH